MIIAIIGVTGTGKSTIGRLLSQRLDLPFIEADDFHSSENVSKMSRGISLTDSDRHPWLQSVSRMLQSEEKKKGAVLACSALKEEYRQTLQRGLHEDIFWIYLEGSEETIRKRMRKREDHFMPEELLPSQMATMEKPSYAYCISIEKDPETIADEILSFLKNKNDQRFGE